MHTTIEPPRTIEPVLYAGSKRVLYLMPSPGPEGGMTAISQMFYSAGVFRNANIRHFNTSFRPRASRAGKLGEGVLKKLGFLVVLCRFRPQAVSVMTSSYWGLYDKCMYCLLARVLGIRTALNPVGGGFSDFFDSSRVHRVLTRLCMKVPNVLLIGSTFWLGYFRDKFEDATILPCENPVLVDLFTHCPASDNGPIRVVTVSSITRSKGIEELVGVIKIVCARSQGFRFVILGRGDMLEWVREQLGTEIARGWVEVRGFVSDDVKRRELAAADLFMLLSHTEVTPIAVLEAMAAQLPVMATRVGGLPDMVNEGVNGFLFEPFTIEPVAATLLDLATQRPRLRGMGQSSRDLALSRYDIHAVVRRQLSILTDS